MKKKSILFSIILCVVLLFSSTVFAKNSIEYFLGGGIEKIVVEEGTLTFNLSGTVDSLETSLNGQPVSITFHLAGNVDEIKTPSGTIDYWLDGELSSVDGPMNKILEEAQTAAQNYYTAVEKYFKSINIDIEGADSPIKDLEKLYDTLSNLITDYNNGGNNNQSTSNDVTSNDATSNNNSSVNINVSGNASENTNNSQTQNNSTVTGNNAAINGYGAEFYTTGNKWYKKLVLPEGIVTWYENGELETIVTDKVTLNYNDQGYLIKAVTPSGSAEATPDGELKQVNGEYATIMAEANAEYEKMNKAYTNFHLNGTITNNGNVNVNVNQNGASVSVGNTVDVNANGNGANISVGNNVGINAGENGANINLGGMLGIDANENGVNINLGGFQLSAGEDGVNIGVGGNNNVNNTQNDEKDNSIVKYILLGLAFLVAFVILVFGIIAIKKKNNQVIVKDNNPNNQ